MNPIRNPYPNPTVEGTPADPDLAEQANPGHGVPSQDPDPAAQQGLTPVEAERESRAALVGGGTIAGAAAGGAVGVAVGGPVGMVIGAAAGALAGAVSGAAVGQVVELEPPREPQSEAAKPVCVEKT